MYQVCSNKTGEVGKTSVDPFLFEQVLDGATHSCTRLRVSYKSNLTSRVQHHTLRSTDKRSPKADRSSLSSEMSPKIAYFLAALLAILCLMQQFEGTAAANTQYIRRVLSREELAARRQLQQNTNNQLYRNQYNNRDNEDDIDDDDDDDDDREDNTDVGNKGESDNSVLRDESSENAAQGLEQNNAEATEGAFANSEEGADVEGRARRRRRGRRGVRRGRKGPRKVRKSRKHSSA